MFKKALIVLSLFTTILSFGLLIFFYDQLPEEIPVFVNLEGKPTSFMYKSSVSVFRLPMMGVMLQGICFTMLFVKPVLSQETHQRLWLSASVLGAFKMTLTAIEILLVEEDPLFLALTTLRISVLSIILVAVISILLNLYELYKTYKENFSLYSSTMNDWHKSFLLLFASGYLILVLTPFFSQN